MQIYLRSHSDCSGRSNTKSKRGFSLVELLIVTAITALISTAVVVRFSSFDGTVLLKSLAYEVAISLREAQVYSLSVLGSDQSFDTPYGMSFTPNSKEYIFFQYLGSPDERPQYDEVNTNDLNTYQIGRSLQVSELCVTTDSGTVCDGIERLDISFRRPEFEAIFYATGDGWSENNNGDITSAEVKVRSLNMEDIWTVETSLLGQITVRKE